MALDTLLTSLAREAEDAALALLSDAREAGERDRAGRLAAIEARRAAHLAARQRALEAEACLAIEDARRAALRGELEARAAALDRVFERAAVLLPEILSVPGAVTLLADSVLAPLAYLGDDDVEVRAHPALVEVLRERLAERPRVTVVADPAVGIGAALTTGDRTLDVDATLETRLARLRPRLAAELTTELASTLTEEAP